MRHQRAMAISMLIGKERPKCLAASTALGLKLFFSSRPSSSLHVATPKSCSMICSHGGRHDCSPMHPSRGTCCLPNALFPGAVSGLHLLRYARELTEARPCTTVGPKSLSLSRHYSPQPVLPFARSLSLCHIAVSTLFLLTALHTPTILTAPGPTHRVGFAAKMRFPVTDK